MIQKTLPLMLLSLILLSGCAATSVSLSVVAVEPVNEAQAGESRPVEIRVYQLRDDARFNQASIDLLWSDAEAALGDSLIDVRLGINIFPEKAQDNPRGREVVIDPLSAEARFIGILALYERSEEGGRQSVVLPVDEAGRVKFTLTGYRIETDR